MSNIQRYIATFFAIVMVGLAFFLAMRPYLQPGFPYTHDGENHLARFANYKIALKEGQIPPRWAPRLFNNYGYPVFNFNYPLANILSLPFSLIKIEYETTYKVLVILSLGLGVIGVWIWLKLHTLTHLHRAILIAGYLLHLPLINLIYFRGSIGEILAYALLPWLLYTVASSKPDMPVSSGTKALRILIWALFFLSHNITVLYVTPLIFAYAIIHAGKNWQIWKQFLWPLICGIGVSLWFWIPAFFEKTHTVLSNTDNNTSLITHMPRLQQLFSTPMTFGFSLPGGIDTLSFQVGALPLMTLLSVILYFCMITLYPKLFAPLPKKELLFISVMIGLIYMQTPYSKGLWEILPFATYVQFPWRLSIVIGVLYLPLLMYILKLNNWYITSLLIIALITHYYSVWPLKPADYFHKTNQDYDAFAQSTSTQNENRAQGFEYQDIHDWQPSPRVATGDADVSVEYWQGSDRKYQVTTHTPGTILVEPTMYFPGWITTVTPVYASTTVPTTQAHYLSSQEIAGRIAFSIESPGTYIIKTSFTQRTPARIIGNFFSVSAILVSIGYIFSTPLTKWLKYSSHSV